MRRLPLILLLSATLFGGSYFFWFNTIDSRDFNFPMPVYIPQKSILMDSVNESITFGNVLDTTGATPFSWSFWLKLDINMVGNARIIGKISTPGYSIASLNSTRMTLFLQGNFAAAVLAQTNTGVLVSPGWAHWVITYSGSKTVAGVKIYKNGVSQTVTSGDNDFAGSASNTAALGFGGGFNGRMTSVSAYNIELSQVQVTRLYNSGKPIDPRYVVPTAQIAGWWKMGNGDTIGTNGIIGSIRGFNGTPVNMEPEDIVNDTP